MSKEPFNGAMVGPLYNLFLFNGGNFRISVISENVKDEKPANVDTFAALKAQLEEINLAVAKAGLEFKAAAHSATGAAGIDQYVLFQCCQYSC